MPLLQTSRKEADLETCFKMMQQKSGMGREWLPADYEYWVKHDMLACNSFADLLQKIRSQQ